MSKKRRAKKEAIRAFTKNKKEEEEEEKEKESKIERRGYKSELSKDIYLRRYKRRAKKQVKQ